LTVDAWDVRIENTIHTPGGLQVSACYPMTTAVRPSLCEYIQRDPTTHTITALLDTPVNVGTERMRGVDIALRYALPTPIGRFGALLDATYLDRYDIVRADGTVLHVKGTQDNMYSDAGATLASLFPSWKYNAGVTWGWLGLGAGLDVRYVGGYHECGDITGAIGLSQCSLDATFVRKVRASDVWDAFVSYAFESGAGKTSLSFGVQNLFDSAPPRVYSAWFPSDPGYDFVGRFFYAMFSHRL
jgi:outer membrane receptor protein involved in Fe transport